MSRLSLAGATALLVAPLTIIAGVGVIPTLSDDAAKQVAALSAHKGAMLTGMTLQTLTIVLMLAGTIWFAFKLASRAPRLAAIGGVLAVAGALVVFFVDAAHAAAAAAALGSDTTSAVATVHAITSSAALKVLEPLQAVQDVGFVLLGIAAYRNGVPRVASAAIVLGTLGESLGFGIGSRPIVGIAFAVLLAGLVPAVRRLTRGELGARVPAEAAIA